MAVYKCNCQSCFHKDICENYHPQTRTCDDYVDSADVVEVVRCKDCVHYIMPNIELCEMYGAMHCIDQNHYCGFGERKKFK